MRPNRRSLALLGILILLLSLVAVACSDNTPQGQTGEATQETAPTEEASSEEVVASTEEAPAEEAAPAEEVAPTEEAVAEAPPATDESATRCV